MKCRRCNETDQPYGALFCHMCGMELIKADNENAQILPKWYLEENTNDISIDNAHNSQNRVAIIRYLFLIIVLLEYIYISIKEYSLFEPWGQVTIGLVNGFSFLTTLIVCVFANHFDQFEEKTGFWRLYYNWLHILFAAIVPILGFLIVINIHNFFALILEIALVSLLLLADFETLEEIINV